MCDVDLWEPPMKIEKKYMRECPLVNAVVKNRYSIDYHRGTGGYKAVYKAYDMQTKRPVCLALFREPKKDADPKTRYIEMGKELEASRTLVKSRLEHQGLLNILDMSEPETPVPIVRGVRTLKTQEKSLEKKHSTQPRSNNTGTSGSRS